MRPSKPEGPGNNPAQDSFRPCNDSRGQGKIFVVGIGPGGEEDLTCRAFSVINDADLLAGYTAYIKLVKEMSCYHGQEVYTTGMTREVERVQYAVEAAGRGLRAAVISSGDAGVYGMAGLVLEVMESSWQSVPLEIIPGIPAANSAAARLGAPLMQDYATISLSDLLTPLPDILDRVEASARADFVIVFYNPCSKSRKEPWDQALSILKKHRRPDTPVGLVSRAGRAGESVKITALGHMDTNEPDMLTTVIVGNSRTRVTNGRMITPRGYEL